MQKRSSRLQKILAKTLITGADGAAGSYVDFGIKTDRDTLDITNWDVVQRKVARLRPKVIIHLAAETDLDRCEKDPGHAYLINTIGTYNMARAAKSVSAKFLYVSTSGVFNSRKKGPYTEADQPDPQIVYARSKYLGEVVVQALLSDFCIARICWMFGGGAKKDNKFVAKIIGQLDQPEIKAVTDSYGSPTYGKDLIQGLVWLIAHNKKGLFHLSNQGVASRYDVAAEVVKFFGKKIKLTPVKNSYFKLSARRGTNEAMTSKLKITRPWRTALREYLAREWQHIK